MSSKEVNPKSRSTEIPDAAEGHYRFWLLLPVLPGRWGRWITGVGLFVAMLALFGLVGSLSPEGLDEVGLGVVFFFSLILAYIVPVHHLIISRSLSALALLGARFPELEADVDLSRALLVHKSRPWVLRALLVGLLAGIGHTVLLLGDRSLTLILLHPPTLLTMFLTVLIWIVMTATISSLIENAVRFARLGTRVPVPLLDIRALTPFGSVAVSSTLAMVGAQAAFPLMFFQSDVSYVSYVPGLVATILPMIYFFVAPTWPVHQRIVAAKRAERERIDSLVRSISGRDGQSVRAYGELAPLLVYRREIAEAGEWPFDTSVMGRLTLYLIIPPLTWVGAALIEMLVDTAF